MFGTPVDVYSETCTQDFVEIGDAVWIGANSVITSGVKIGNGVIIGAGSVVTKDIPSWTLAVGNPARVVKHYDEEDLTFL
jgi:maltose O-acetyltransferase